MAKDGTNRGRKKGSLGEARKRLVEIHQELEREGKTDPGAVIVKLYEMAVSGDGDAVAAKEYLNRRFGTSPESLDVTSNGETLELSPEQREEREERLWEILSRKRESKGKGKVN
jgi:hypothetical protein